MKEYPSIKRRGECDTSGYFYGFDKLDGSMIRVEWTPKSGFYKFGRRDGLLDDSNPFLPESKGLIMELVPDLENFLKKNKHKHAVAFFEFLGQSSFAGNHEVEPHRVFLVDISLDKKGLVDPKVLVDLAEVIPSAELLHKGPLDQYVLRMIEDGIMAGMTFEGVVFKRMEKNRRIMFKHKSRAWIERLKNRCGDNEKLFQKLL